MHWIINSGLRREVGYEAMIARLEARGTPHALVRKPPLVGHLVADEPDEADGLHPIMLDPIEGPVFVIGTTRPPTTDPTLPSRLQRRPACVINVSHK